MTKTEAKRILEKLKKAPGKKLIAGTTLYSFALIKRKDKQEWPAIVKRPVNGNYKDWEIVAYVPNMKI